MEMKKYMDIERMKDGWFNICEPGDEIYIEEKIDGANCGIRYDPETDTLVPQSRKRVLELGQDDLRGFGNFIRSLSDEAATTIKELLEYSDDLVLFGEWLVPHTVSYPSEAYRKAYFYDIYSMSAQGYFCQREVYNRLETAIKKGAPIHMAPVFYKGPFISWEHVNNFAGESDLGAEIGEGIVIKNQTKLNNPNTRQPFYVKIVTENFKEIQKSNHVKKEIDPNAAAQLEADMALTKEIVTEARVRKMLNKFVDEAILSEDWSIADMKIIAQNLTKRIIEDCIKEEKETVEKIGSFSKTANKVCMSIAKSIAMSR